MKRREGSISFRRGLPGRTSKGYGASDCWKGVPVVGERLQIEAKVGLRVVTFREKPSRTGLSSLPPV